MYVCMFVSLTQISLTPIATLYDNGFSGRVQNSSRAFNYPRSAPRSGRLAASCALARDRRNQTAESQLSEGSLSAAARGRNKHKPRLNITCRLAEKFRIEIM